MRKGDVKHNVPQVITRAKDLKTKKSYTGCNRQLRQNLRKTRGGMSTSQAKKNSIFKGGAKSNVQKKAPNAIKRLSRDPCSCAEHQALHKLYDDRPSAKPSDIRTCSVKVDAKNSTIQAIKRCDNCMEFGRAMGNVPTDAINGLAICENPGYPVSKTGVAMVVGSAAYSAMKQRSKASHGSSKTVEKTNDGESQTAAAASKQTKTKHIKTKNSCSRQLHHNNRGRLHNGKMKRYKALVPHGVITRDDGQLQTVAISETGQKTPEEWTSDLDDEDEENICTSIIKCGGDIPSGE